ncbi:MAG: hypothetical protein ACOZAK_03370 [Patescibacteria group bacterium]
MSETKPKIRTENLDGSPATTTLDEARDVRHNHDLSSIGIKTLNLTTEKEKKDMQSQQKKMLAVVVFVALAAGFGTGFGAFKLKMKTSATESPQADQQVAGDVVKAGDVFGIKDDQTFKDSAEGYLAEGGVDGEGSHRLLREGGESQTVYLTSSITDLDKLVGMQVKVWGETFKGQKAGWLMDVGRIQVVEVKAEPPVEE